LGTTLTTQGHQAASQPIRARGVEGGFLQVDPTYHVRTACHAGKVWPACVGARVEVILGQARGRVGGPVWCFGPVHRLFFLFPYSFPFSGLYFSFSFEFKFQIQPCGKSSPDQEYNLNILLLPLFIIFILYIYFFSLFVSILGFLLDSKFPFGL
jgi:hypothetical protein